MATRISVASTSVRLFSETPNIVRDSVLGAVTAKMEFSMNTILDNYHNSIGVKTGNFLSYAKNSYTLGLPGGRLELGQGREVDIKAVLEVIEGEPVTILSNVVSAFIPGSYGAEIAQRDYGWSPETNIVSNPPFTPNERTTSVSLLSVTVVSSTMLRFTFNATQEYNGKVYVLKTVSDVVIPAINVNANWYHIIYQPSSGGTEKYWNYDSTKGTYPTLTGASTTKLDSPFYPIVPLRLDNVNMSDDTTTPLYKTSRTLINTLGMDMDSLCTAIEDNPDVAAIDHAFIYAGVNLQAEEKESIRYLHDFFAYLFQSTGSRKVSYDRWWALENFVTGAEKYGYSVKEDFPARTVIAIEDSKFKVDFSFNYIDLQVVEGNIGELGFIERETVIEEPYYKLNGNFTIGSDAHERSRLILRKQINATQYTEIVVHGLMHTNYIYSDRFIATTLANSLEEDNNNFLVPLNRFVVKSMPFYMEVALYYQAFNIVFNSFEITKLKWYESGLFQGIIMVIAIVVTIYTIGQSWQAIVAAAGAQATAITLAIEVLKKLLLGVAIGEAFQILVKVIGPEFAMIVAIVGMVYAAGKGIQAGSIRGAPWAEEILKLSQTLIKAVQDVTADAMEEVIQEMTDFSAEAKTKSEELKAAQDLLVNDINLDPMSFVGLVPLFIPYETPDEFMYRTLHSGNTENTIDAISNYVESALLLPRTDETI